MSLRTMGVPNISPPMTSSPFPFSRGSELPIWCRCSIIILLALWSPQTCDPIFTHHNTGLVIHILLFIVDSLSHFLSSIKGKLLLICWWRERLKVRDQHKKDGKTRWSSQNLREKVNFNAITFQLIVYQFLLLLNFNF